MRPLLHGRQLKDAWLGQAVALKSRVAEKLVLAAQWVLGKLDIAFARLQSETANSLKVFRSVF